MTTAAKEWEDTFDPPYVRITPHGRWWHVVTIIDGVMAYGPGGYGWHVFGRKRAERIGRRKLRKYLNRQQLSSTPIIIREGQ